MRKKGKLSAVLRKGVIFVANHLEFLKNSTYVKDV